MSVGNKRIGVMVPSTSPTVEPDFYTALPAISGVTLHFARMYNGHWGNQPEKPEDEAYLATLSAGEKNDSEWMLLGADNNMMNADVERCARSLANVRPDVIAYAITAGTWLKGSLAFDREMAERIRRAAGGVPAVTAFGSCLAALRAAGARRVSLASPYWDSTVQGRLVPLLREAGFDVVSSRSTPSTQESSTPVAVDSQDPRAIMEFVSAAVEPEADTVFLPCTAWRALEIAEALERSLGKKVVTSTQATIWNALRTIGHRSPVPGYGWLLREMPAGAADPQA